MPRAILPIPAARQPLGTSSTIEGYADVHNQAFLNDGFYGNGKSWISGAAGAFITTDLGLVQMFD